MAVSRQALWVHTMAAYEKSNIQSSWKRAKSNRLSLQQILWIHTSPGRCASSWHNTGSEMKRRWSSLWITSTWSNKTAQCRRPSTSTDIQHTCSRHNSQPWNQIKVCGWLTNKNYKTTSCSSTTRRSNLLFSIPEEPNWSRMRWSWPLFPNGTNPELARYH